MRPLLANLPRPDESGPGVMPRRSLEWFLAVGGCFGALYVLFFEEGVLPRDLLGLRYDLHFVGWLWAALVLLASTFQLWALFRQHQGLRWFAAGTATVVWLVASVDLVGAGFHALGPPYGFSFCGGEFVVFCVLRGARLWTR